MNGRDQEFGEFMRNRASPLHQSAYLLCGDWHLAHDLVQDTLVKAYQHWPRVRQADSPDAYVRRILLNEARSRWRRRERTETVSRFPEEREPVAPDATDEIARRAGLLQALQALPLRQRELDRFAHRKRIRDPDRQHHRRIDLLAERLLRERGPHRASGRGRVLHPYLVRHGSAFDRLPAPGIVGQ
jgi:hypothetical protein